MNPNQPNNSPPYSNQFKPNQFNNYQFSNQQQFNPNTLNVPKNNFQQGGSISPTDSHQVNRNKLDRAMYSSTIEGTLPSKSFGLGKLQSMGRFIGGNDDLRNQHNKPAFEFQGSSNHFVGQKTFEPQFQASKQNEFDRFPSFNLNDNNGHQSSSNGQNYHQQVSQAEQNHGNQTETLTAEQKRRREILAIKQELAMINKKMQSSNLNKKYSSQQAQNDFKPPNTSQPSSTTHTNYLNPPISTSNQSTGSSYGTTNYDTTSSFTRNNNQLTIGQRNKGLVTQSMIVSNQPSTGFKYQSIFDKYDSMKKPTYEMTEAKEEKPSLLDQFVKKGPGSEMGKEKKVETYLEFNKEKKTEAYLEFNKEKKVQTYLDFNKEKKVETYTFSSSSNSPNSQTVNKNGFDFSSGVKNTSSSMQNFSSTYGITQNSNISNPPINSGMSLGQSNTQQPNQGGMFKKKKFTEQLNTQYTPTTSFLQKPFQPQPSLSFKKSPRNAQHQQNIITSTLKQMKIEQSQQFKRQDFIVGKKLGKGQFGQVMLVQHKKTGFLCGMKVMEKKQIRDQKYEGQIARELSVQFYLSHRNIAPLYGYFQDQKNVYLLVQYCTGGQLLELLRKNRRMQEPQVSRIIRQIIEGIDYIHKQLIIHRDIKPENILFNFGVAKICDYGWAVYKGHGMRKTASVGSPLYYSPEIVMGVEYDQKIDIWDIGMMTYQCLLGKIPFRIYSELDLNRIVQDEIKFPQYIDTTDQARDFILRIMKKKPEQRMEIRQMLRHPFITKYQDQKLPIEIMKDFKEVLG